MKKTSLIAAVVLGAGLGLSMVTGLLNPKDENRKMVLKLSHTANLEQPYHLAAEKFAQDVYDRTNGQIEIQVFPNSQLGGMRDTLEGTQMGSVDITLVGSSVLGNFIPTAQVLDMPFIFQDSQHVYDVVDGPMADQIYAGDEEIGMKVICTWENGFRNVGNNIRPVHKPEDLKGVKLRVFESSLYIDMFEKMGAICTPMAMSEVFTALQQKTIDGTENAIVQIYASKYQEVMKYLTLTEHTYNPECVVFSKYKWDQISEKNQEIILECAREARDFNRELAKEKTVEYLQKLKDAGMEVTELTPEEKQEFQDVMMPVWEEYYDEVGEDLIQEVAHYGGR